MMNKTIFFFIIFALLLIGPLFTSTGQDLSFSGYLKNYTGLQTKKDPEYNIQNSFNLNMEFSTKMFAFKVNPILKHYASYEQNLVLNLKEMYMDLYFNNVDLRIGKQQIIWGKAEGVFITDVVSPKDLSEFLLPDFDEIRIGVNAVKTDIFIGPTSLEIVFIPIFTASVLPDSDSIWSVTPSYPVTPTINDTEKVKLRFINSEIFSRFSYLGSVMDFEIMGGYMWDDEPAPHVTNPVLLEITPEHHRLALVGGSFSTGISNIILRVEAAFYFGKYFRKDNPATDEGVLKKNYVHYLLGSDFSILGVNFSAQFIQQIILGYDEAIIKDQLEHMITFRMSKTFLRETLKIELFSYIGINAPDALIRLKLVYDLTDSLEIFLGSNIFLGDEGLFGQYNDNKMVYTGLKFSF